MILCSGKPGMFIAGADLKELASVKPGRSDARTLDLRGLNFIGRFEKLPCPTVALIDGACMGGGTGAGARRSIIASPARIRKPRSACRKRRSASSPAGAARSGCRASSARAWPPRLICTGEPVKAAQRRELGIVWDVVPPREDCSKKALRLLAWSRESGEWKKIRVKKQQPVGLSEEQANFTFAVAKAVVFWPRRKGSFPPRSPL